MKNKIKTIGLLLAISILGNNHIYAQQNSEYDEAVQETIKRNKEIEKQYQEEVKKTIINNKKQMSEYRQEYNSAVEKAIENQGRDNANFRSEVVKQERLNYKALNQSNDQILQETREEIKAEIANNRENAKADAQNSELNSGNEITLEVGKDSDLPKPTKELNGKQIVNDEMENIKTIN